MSLPHTFFIGRGGGSSLTVEDVFSTDVYTGNETEKTIVNGIDLANEGGLVWAKNRVIAFNHNLYDTVRGVGKYLVSNNTSAEAIDAQTLKSFNSNGFTLGSAVGGNHNSATVAFTFRVAPKFFDIQSWTGNGGSYGTTQSIAHNLGSVPGMILVKRTSADRDWAVYHRGTDGTAPEDKYLLFKNHAVADDDGYWFDTAPTATHFTVHDKAEVNSNGSSYIAYIFADNSSDSSISAADRMISCGSYAGNGSDTGPVINVGFQPQFIFYKCITANENWEIIDSVRGVTTNGDDKVLRANLNGAELNTQRVNFLSNGWQPKDSGGHINGSGQTYIYMAIRAEG